MWTEQTQDTQCLFSCAAAFNRSQSKRISDDDKAIFTANVIQKNDFVINAVIVG